MTQERAPSVLSRKTQAHRLTSSNALAPEKALSVAALRACDQSLHMHAASGTAKGGTLSLTEVLESLPEKGMTATLDGPGQAVGLVALDMGSLSALVEQLTMGRVLPADPEDRRATRTDAALLSDWVEEILTGMVGELIDAAEDPVAAIRAAAPFDGYRFGHLIQDPRPLALMPEDVPYHALDVMIGFGEVARAGRIFVALVEKPALSDPVDDTLRQEAWRRDMADTLLQARAELTAVLHRTELPIGKLRKLAPGDKISVPIMAVGEVRMEATDDHCVALARLGQSMGQRAVRLVSPPDAKALQDPFEEEQNTPGLPAPPGLDPGGETIDLDRLPVTDVPDITMPDLPDIDGAPDLDGASFGEDLDFPGLSDLPGMEDLVDLDGQGGGGGLPALDDLPEMEGLPDLDDLPSLSDTDGDLPGDFPALDDLPDLGDFGQGDGEQDDFPALADLPQIT